ncbi:dihydrolipoamide acetyltransferase family protein [Arenibacter echinorum]|uniref:Dihydrolipoamide acetyltransferase component of pyruvate dehydrogenase complex n=1 Tax=Arenibacter echinorum TaxID=440515 RepID=A0A327QPG0_9FLAO|nr:dihydrolipoamide acetyltransferase family protein [Arenibacter echinorum]RAJ05594.1 2-oxoglutarate dehydrogenase E2 component (dihydrolipoamide succinyltransferase) [Arenibacter echinorum]
MSKFELKLPQMGESVAEATLTTWLKEVGDTIEMDEAVFEIATDKVDSEVPSEVDGILVEKLFNIDDVVKVGQTVAIIEINGSSYESDHDQESHVTSVKDEAPNKAVEELEVAVLSAKESAAAPVIDYSGTDRFYSPLVKNIAKQEGITLAELDTISGTGSEGRVTKNDILDYVASGKANGGQPVVEKKEEDVTPVVEKVEQLTIPVPVKKEEAKQEEVKPALEKEQPSNGDEYIPLTRMGKLIVQHMNASVATSAHVQSFVEVDVTNVVNWRNKVKDAFEKREGEKLTFTPIFMEAVAIALKKYPMVNISLDGDTIIKKKNINIGMAAALADGNLIVPVIKNADQLNLVGMAKAVNDLAKRARNNALKPDEVKDGTYTVTNVGTFGSVFGTPIINQPQVGILALGAIRKMPAVVETKEGDFIAIRSKMYLSHSYDHRVVNGALGGMFVKAVADHLEAWDVNREI